MLAHLSHSQRLGEYLAGQVGGGINVSSVIMIREKDGAISQIESWMIRRFSQILGSNLEYVNKIRVREIR